MEERGVEFEIEAGDMFKKRGGPHEQRQEDERANHSFPLWREYGDQEA